MPTAAKKAVKKTASKPPSQPRIQGVHRKLVKVMEAIGSIPQLGHNDFHNYAYVRESDVLRAVRKEFIAQGLTMTAAVDGEVVVSAHGKSRLVSLPMKYVITDSEDDSKIVKSWHTEAADTSDKALAKAFTASHKSFLRALLMLPSGEDPEEKSPPVVLTDEQEKVIARLPDAMPVFRKRSVFLDQKEEDLFQGVLDDWQQWGATMPMSPKRWTYFIDKWNWYVDQLRDQERQREDDNETL